MEEVTGENLSSASKPEREPLTRSIVMASIIAFGVVSFWRGVWYLWDVLVFPAPEDKLMSGLASTIAGIVILALMRTFYSVLAPPIARVNIRGLVRGD